MAQVVKFVDDMDGTDKDVSTVRFAFKGRAYEIDLSAANVEKLTKALEPYTTAGRTAGSAPKPRDKSERLYEPEQLREWQAANGRKVTTRGRFTQADIDAYLAR